MVSYKKFKRVNNLVSTNYKSTFTIIRISFLIILKAIWISIIQYMNSTIVKIDKKKYRVTYIINGRTYKMIVNIPKGPRKVLLVYDENEEDVSHLVFPYLGPVEDFHGKEYTPEFFKRMELVFVMSNGNELLFTKKILTQNFSTFNFSTQNFCIQNISTQNFPLKFFQANFQSNSFYTIYLI